MGIMKRIYTEAGKYGKGSLQRFTLEEKKAIQVLIRGCVSLPGAEKEDPALWKSDLLEEG